MMDTSYCLKCKKQKYLVKSTYNICKSKKLKFISKQDASDFLSQLFSKIPILNKIIQYMLMYYYKKLTKNDYEDDIRNLNNKIDIIYSLLENITKDRNDLLILFNSRINHNILDENIFHDDVYVNSDNKFKLIFTCKSKPSDIYKYIFHILIKCDYNEVDLKL